MSEVDNHKVIKDSTGRAIAAAIGDVAEAIRTGFSDLIMASLLTKDNYRSVMKAWFEAHGSSALNDYTDLCEQWYEATRTGWTGGVRFRIPGSGETASSDGYKTGDNVGMECVPSTPVSANRDDYASVPLFYPIDVNMTLDSNGDPHITAIAGVCGNFTRVDSTKIVAVMQMTGWERFIVDTVSGVYGWDYTDTPNTEGFHPLPEAVSLYDNSVRNFVVHGKYSAGEGWTCCSGQRVKVWDVSHNTCRSGIHTAWGNQYCGFTSADSAFLQLMFFLKYGRLDSDRNLVGCCDYNYDYTPALAESNVERILITTAQAANLIVGSTVCYGASARASGSTVDRRKITKIEEVTISNTTYGAVYVDNNGVKFSTSTSGHLTTMQWYTGTTDTVLGNDGGINPESGKYPVKIQGIEYMVGCWEVIGDTILNHETISGVAVGSPHICRDASKIAEEITFDYEASGYGIPKEASAGWKYPKQLRSTAALPELIFPIDIGGSTSGGPRDGFYLEAQSATGTREWLRFGDLDNGLASAGLSAGYGSGGLGVAYWSVGGRLSVTGNRGEFQAAA